MANRHARQSLSPQPLPVSPRVRRRRKQPAAKKAPSSLPPGWFGGKLDDGTAFWYHEDDPGDVRFEWPESDSPKASKPERSKPDASANLMPAEIMLHYYRKHRPDYASKGKVAEVILSHKLDRKFRRDWAEVMYAAHREAFGEDPRDVAAAL